MFDMRPVFYVIGLLVAVLGATMLIPMGVDLALGRPDWPVFLESAVISVVVVISGARTLEASSLPPRPVSIIAISTLALAKYSSAIAVICSKNDNFFSERTFR